MLRMTKDHRGRMVATTQAPALQEKKKRITVVRLPDGSEHDVERRSWRGTFACLGLECRKLADLKMEIRQDHPGAAFTSRLQ